jgi:DinB superfamily
MTKHATEEAALGQALRKQLQALLDGGQAHATFDEAVKGFPAKLRGVVPEGLPYSGWQILEHIRITQRDILEFSSNTDGSYKELKWPEEYWPKSAEPPSAEAWERSIEQVHEDRKAFEKLLKAADDAELVAPFAWGDGQSLLREALLVADHDAYHVGELVVLRRLLGAWKK